MPLTSILSRKRGEAAVTFEDIFFYSFDELCVGHGSRQWRDNVNIDFDERYVWD